VSKIGKPRSNTSSRYSPGLPHERWRYRGTKGNWHSETRHL